MFRQNHTSQFSTLLPQYTESYRYGFNGQEKENSVNGSYSTTSAEYWMYDGRLGRRWEVDPLSKKYPFQSPYAAFNNNPIYFKDSKGLEGENIGDGSILLDEVTVTANSESPTPRSIPAQHIALDVSRDLMVPLLTMERKKILEKHHFIFNGPFRNLSYDTKASEKDERLPAGTATSFTPERFNMVNGSREMLPLKVWQMEMISPMGVISYYFYTQQPKVEQAKIIGYQVGNRTPLNRNNSDFRSNLEAVKVLIDLDLENIRPTLKEGQEVVVNIVISTNLKGPEAEAWVKSQLGDWVSYPGANIVIKNDTTVGGIPTATVSYQIIISGTQFNYGDGIQN